MRRILIIMAVALTGIPLFAQTTPEEMAADLNKTGGIYFAYPATSADNTPAPKGYQPFHISHYGRHGSRYLIGDNDYEWMAKLLHKASEENVLTPLGVSFMNRLDSLMIETKGRGGDLSPLGRRQHHDIADRMYRNYPQVFTPESHITARSTLVPRCILSMASFCESLKEKNPALYIEMESSNRNMPYLCHSVPESDSFNGRDGWWQEVYRKFEEKQTTPERAVNSIFSSPEFIEKYVNPHDFMWGIYWIASDAQNTEGKIDFYDLLTPRELFDLWQCFNARFYAQHADYAPAKGVHLRNAENLLNNIIDTADEAIASKQPSAALRFGHDGNVIPLTTLMNLEGCGAVIERPEDFYKGWTDWKISPMAGNIQLVFFRNPKNPDVLVKILHNEKETTIPVATDMWPYYKWDDVKSYFKSRMKGE
ncbi:MAG: histidine phosphatase family protein [Muribaculaceae bacterium]|nr:histidine phosphatase family protein [Muribaculaceae bacterium]